MKGEEESKGGLLSKTHFEYVLAEPENTIRKTKIVCTIGPSCWSVENLCKMLNTGMNVARFNFSHGDHPSHKKALDNLREAVKETGKQCAVMLDTKGPEIRTGLLKEHKKISLKKDQTLEINTNYAIEGDSNMITCSWKNLPLKVKAGAKIYIADGSLTCEVVEVKPPDRVIVKVLNDAEIGEKKNMNCPGTDVDLPTISDKDETDIVDFGLKHGVDMIAASFIRSAEDVETIRDLLGPRGSHIMIISKIENHQGLYNYDEILKASDGIMVARGDLGMEVEPEKVFVCQKWMIEKANIAAKPVITATQMLESMVSNPRPTRAEASDVANAVLDGTDCVMLSGETAGGQHPLASVLIMAKICREAERVVNYPMVQKHIRKSTPKPLSMMEAICASAANTALEINANLTTIKENK